MNLIITGDAGEICSEEILKSQNKSFVPQFTSKSGNFNKEQPPKVMYILGSGGVTLFNITVYMKMSAG